MNQAWLFNQGENYQSYKMLGARPHVSPEGEAGYRFAVWAPRALSVSAVGDFNGWDPEAHPLQSYGTTGIWQGFIPGAEEWQRYKYAVTAAGGRVLLKADPFARHAETRPGTASILYDGQGDHDWQDASYMARRRDALEAGPLNIYEVHLGSWRRYAGGQSYSYREIAPQLASYCLDMGYNAVELMPVTEYPLDASWGYQVTGYYSVTSRYGTPADFKYFVDVLHQQGLCVILDWVPAHFPKDMFGLNRFDGTQLYAHANPLQGEHQDWGTLIFNYSRNEVRAFLISNALFWIDKYHIDGLRVDAVASMLYLDYSRKDGEWIPNEYGGRENLAAISFLRKTNEVVHGVFPGVLTIAEESTSWPMVSRPTYLGGLGFSLKWNMGWMHDTLSYMTKNSLFRRYHHNQLTFGMLYAFHENFVLPISHDEVVHGKGSLLGKMSGDEWQKFANLRAYLSFMWGYSGKKLLFMGCEFGQWQEWNHDTGLEWGALSAPTHLGAQRLVRDLNLVYQNEPALYQADFDWTGFSWIDANDSDNSVLSFIRYAKDPADFVIVVSNFTPVVRQAYRIGVPRGGDYRELINSDQEVYAGSGVGNGPVHSARMEQCHGKEHTLSLVLPPLATLFLKPC